MRFITPYVLGFICLFCYSCSLKQNHALFDQRTKLTTDTAKIFVNRIKPDDILQIRNIQDYRFLGGEATAGGAASAIGQTYQVDEDGNVLLPAVGYVSVGGLTKTEAQKKVQEIYTTKLLTNDAIIELKILNLKVTILGEISSQGNYPLTREKTSLIDIIGSAGGLTKGADEKNIKIIRGPQKKEINVDLSNVNTLADPSIIMQDNDVVYVNLNKRAVRDDKLQSFSTIVQPSLLIFNTALIILTLFR